MDGGSDEPAMQRDVACQEGRHRQQSLREAYHSSTHAADNNPDATDSTTRQCITSSAFTCPPPTGCTASKPRLRLRRRSMPPAYLRCCSEGRHGHHRLRTTILLTRPALCRSPIPTMRPKQPSLPTALRCVFYSSPLLTTNAVLCLGICVCACVCVRLYVYVCIALRECASALACCAACRFVCLRSLSRHSRCCASLSAASARPAAAPPSAWPLARQAPQAGDPPPPPS